MANGQKKVIRLGCPLAVIVIVISTANKFPWIKWPDHTMLYCLSSCCWFYYNTFWIKIISRSIMFRSYKIFIRKLLFWKRLWVELCVLENHCKNDFTTQLFVHIISESHSFGLTWAIIRTHCFPLPTIHFVMVPSLFSWNSRNSGPEPG